MMRLNAYLRFGGNAGEAMEFYRDCLEAKLTLMKVKDSPMANQMPPKVQNQVIHALLEKPVTGRSKPATWGRFKSGHFWQVTKGYIIPFSPSR
jgi:hypothetical protein